MNATKWPCVSQSADIQAHYEQMREDGESHMLAEMLAFRRAPGAETDTTLFAGKMSLADQFKHDPEGLKRLTAKAKAQGIAVNPSDQYLPQLATEPLDPKALVSHAEGKSKIKKLCEQQGINCYGQVKVKAYRAEETKMTPLHPKLVEKSVNQMIAKNPDLARKDRRELREKAVHEHGFHRHAKPRKLNEG